MVNLNQFVQIIAQFEGDCILCGGPIHKGDTIHWHRHIKTAIHTDCLCKTMDEITENVRRQSK